MKLQKKKTFYVPNNDIFNGGIYYKQFGFLFQLKFEKLGENRLNMTASIENPFQIDFV